jgi:hypothetical protein
LTTNHHPLKHKETVRAKTTKRFIVTKRKQQERKLSHSTEPTRDTNEVQGGAYVLTEQQTNELVVGTKAEGDGGVVVVERD